MGGAPPQSIPKAVLTWEGTEESINHILYHQIIIIIKQIKQIASLMANIFPSLILCEFFFFFMCFLYISSIIGCGYKTHGMKPHTRIPTRQFIADYCCAVSFVVRVR